MPIQILSQELIGHIAAGEVIERPASIVKELVENSIDAKALEIKVNIEGGGKEKIIVSDDGCGMMPQDASLCFARHATSKISRLDDLENISTLGFRGEALHSIYSVSKLTLETQSVGANEGFYISCAGGRVLETRSHGCPNGTKITISDIFYNTPARKKFLKGEKTEEGHIIDIISRLALAYPDIRFMLTSDGKEKFSCISVGKPKERLIEIFGDGVAVSARPFCEDGAGIKIYGHLGEPLHSTKIVQGIYIFVNGRFVKDKVINHAVQEGYRGLIPSGQYPFTVLHLEIDPARVDVNVHPTKQEVRFENSGAVHNFVAMTVKKALNKCPTLTDTAGVSRHSMPESLTVAVSVRRLSDVCHSRESGDPMQVSVGRLSQQGFFSSLRVIGQLAGSFILCEGEDKKFIAIDQHAAHERIGFEQLKKELKEGKIVEQRLLIPEQLLLPPKEHSALVENLKMLETLGFEAELFGGNTLIIKSMPALLVDTDIKPLVSKLARELTEFASSASTEEKVEEILRSIACHQRVRAHHKLSEPEMYALLRQMDEWPNTMTCPHGRPTYIEYSEEEVSKWFKRT